MSRLTWLRLPWLFNRRVGVILLWTLLVFGVAFAMTLIGIRTIGSIQGWQNWLRAQAGYFFVWRVGVYGVTAYFGWQTHRHLRQRQSNAADYQPLRLIGVGAVITVLVTESSQWLQHG